MKNNIKIAVIGGTGKSGKYLIQELIKKGYNFKVLVRNPENFKVGNNQVKIVHGNVDDYETVKNLLKGCHVVLSALGSGIPRSKPTIFTSGTRNVLKAMKEVGLKRYVLLTGLNVNTPFDKKSQKTKYATDWMYTNFPKSTKDRQDEYDLLVKSNLDWTLVRLPLIELTDERRQIEASIDDCRGDGIGATDLANFLISQINDKSYIQKAPFLFNI